MNSDDLWTRFVAGWKLSDEEERVLFEALKANPTLREQYLRDAQLHAMLRAVSGGDADAEAVAKAFLGGLEAERGASRFVRKVESRLGARPRRRRGPGVAIAAALAACLVVALALFAARGSPPKAPRAIPASEPVPVAVEAQEPPPRVKKVTPPTPPPPETVEPERKPPPAPPVAPEPPAPPALPQVPEPKPENRATATHAAQVVRVEGEAYIVRDGVREPAREGVGILAGDGLATVGEKSLLLVALADKTRLELQGPTEVREVGKRIVTGTLRAEVVPQPKDRPMVFVTPHAEATVLGTTLRLVVDPDPKKGTRLEVEEGKVRLKNLSGKAVDVPSGHMATAAVGVDLVAKPVSFIQAFAGAQAFGDLRGWQVVEWGSGNIVDQPSSWQVGLFHGRPGLRPRSSDERFVVASFGDPAWQATETVLEIDLPKGSNFYVYHGWSPGSRGLYRWGFEWQSIGVIKNFLGGELSLMPEKRGAARTYSNDMSYLPLPAVPPGRVRARIRVEPAERGYLLSARRWSAAAPEPREWHYRFADNDPAYHVPLAGRLAIGAHTHPVHLAPLRRLEQEELPIFRRVEVFPVR